MLTACSADAGDNAGSTQNTQATENQATDKSDSSGDNEDASQNTEANEGSDSPSQESSTDETQSTLTSSSLSSPNFQTVYAWL